jgi:hypothetical protein
MGLCGRKRVGMAKSELVVVKNGSREVEEGSGVIRNGSRVLENGSVWSKPMTWQGRATAMS